MEDMEDMEDPKANVTRNKLFFIDGSIIAQLAYYRIIS
jgi:hypothetical protein